MADRHHKQRDTVLTHRGSPRVAVIGAGIGGLSCARELAVRGYDPVVFEASDRLGGRCSSRNTRIGWFDDGAQVITGSTRLAAYAAQRPDRLAASHAWTMASAPIDTDKFGKSAGSDADELDEARPLELIGTVGVPSMFSLAQDIAKPLDVRLHTAILHAARRGTSWVLHTAAGDIDEDFQAMVLAVPAPHAMGLVRASASLSKALRPVRYRNRWVLLLGSERSIALPSYKEFEGGPIDRIAAMHSKPGRTTTGPQKWFIEANERWSLEHAGEDPETVAELMLDNFQALARRPLAPCFLLAHQWGHAFVEKPAQQAEPFKYLWDESLLVGVCGDSVVSSGVDHVHRSGSLLAAQLADSLTARRWRSAPRDLRRATRDLVDMNPAHA